MAVNEKIRIKIKGYEHAVVDAAAAKIVEAVKRSGAQVSGDRKRTRLNSSHNNQSRMPSSA